MDDAEAEHYEATAGYGILTAAEHEAWRTAIYFSSNSFFKVSNMPCQNFAVCSRSSSVELLS